MANISATAIRNVEHLKVFEQLMEARFAALDIEAVLIYIIDNVDASALYFLADQFDVLGYKGWLLATTDQERRDLIKNAIELQRYKGTPWAVKEAIKKFGYADVTIQERLLITPPPTHNGVFQHNGQIVHGGNSWATFRVIIDATNSGTITSQQISILRELIDEYKNVRSLLIDLSFGLNFDDFFAIAEDESLEVESDDTDSEDFLTPMHNGVFTHNGYMQHDSDTLDVSLTIANPEALAWANNVSLNGGTVSGATLQVVSDFFDAIAPHRSDILRFNPFVGDQLAAALVPVLFNDDGSGAPIGNAVDVNVNFVEANYNPSYGLSGTGAAYLATGIIPSAVSQFGLNSAGFGFYQLDNFTSGLGVIGTNPSGTSILAVRNLSNSVVAGVNNTAGIAGTGVFDARGLTFVTRNSNTGYERYKNGDAVVNVTAASTSKATTELFIFRTGNVFSAADSAGYIITKGINATAYAAIRTAWNNLNAALGRPTY